MTAYFQPYFKIKYFETEDQVDSSCEILSDLIIIDGFFFANDTNKFSLGYQYNLNRSKETTHFLSKIGYGIGFSRTDDDELYVKSLTQIPVFILISDSREQIVINKEESKKIYDMADYIKNTALPPKKKKDLKLEDLTIRVSFGVKFEISPPQHALSDSQTINYPVVRSPCWCQLDLLKFIDINILVKK